MIHEEVPPALKGLGILIAGKECDTEDGSRLDSFFGCLLAVLAESTIVLIVQGRRNAVELPTGASVKAMSKPETHVGPSWE